MQEQIGYAYEGHLRKDLLQDDFCLCLTPELVDQKLHENCVKEFAWQVLEELRYGNEISLVAVKPSQVKSSDIYNLF